MCVVYDSGGSGVIVDSPCKKELDVKERGDNGMKTVTIPSGRSENQQLWGMPSPNTGG